MELHMKIQKTNKNIEDIILNLKEALLHE